MAKKVTGSSEMLKGPMTYQRAGQEITNNIFAMFPPGASIGTLVKRARYGNSRKAKSARRRLVLRGLWACFQSINRIREFEIPPIFGDDLDAVAADHFGMKRLADETDEMFREKMNSILYTPLRRLAELPAGFRVTVLHPTEAEAEPCA